MTVRKQMCENELTVLTPEWQSLHVNSKVITTTYTVKVIHPPSNSKMRKMFYQDTIWPDTKASITYPTKEVQDCQNRL